MINSAKIVATWASEVKNSEPTVVVPLTRTLVVELVTLGEGEVVEGGTVEVVEGGTVEVVEDGFSTSEP